MPTDIAGCLANFSHCWYQGGLQVRVGWSPVNLTDPSGNEVDLENVGVWLLGGAALALHGFDGDATVRDLILLVRHKPWLMKAIACATDSFPGAEGGISKSSPGSNAIPLRSF